ncbi:MAG: hypothetical protein M9894_33050 [Planctomycetes bacterium]|nr:hypothetical protein [Planctomycetota bacterium]
MSQRSISVSDLTFVRDVLIPRCAYVEGPEVNTLVQLRLRIDAIFTDIEVELAASSKSLAPAALAPASAVVTPTAVTAATPVTPATPAPSPSTPAAPWANAVNPAHAGAPVVTPPL